MNMASEVAVRVTRRYGARPERVFDAWVDPSVAGRWLFATALHPARCLEMDARKGGSFRFLDRTNGADVVRTGVYVEIDRPRQIVFTLGAGRRRRASRVIARISRLGSGCELRLTHENLPSEQARAAEGRWLGMLYGLGEALSRRGGGTSGRRGG